MRMILVLAGTLAVAGAIAAAAMDQQSSPAGAATPGRAAPARQSLDDAATTARIKTAYLLNAHINAFRINVDTTAGVVSLDGVVKTAYQKELAEEIAKNAGGVKTVRSNLQVNEHATVSEPPEVDRTFSQAVVDATLTASIKAALAVDKTVRARDIKVSTRWSTVTLAGTAATADEKRRAEEIARGTAGVKQVVNNIQVAG